MWGIRSGERGNNETRMSLASDNYLGLHMAAQRDVPPLGASAKAEEFKQEAGLGCFPSIRLTGYPGILLASERLAAWLSGQPEYQTCPLADSKGDKVGASASSQHQQTFISRQCCRKRTNTGNWGAFPSCGLNLLPCLSAASCQTVCLLPLSSVPLTKATRISECAFIQRLLHPSLLPSFWIKILSISPGVQQTPHTLSKR